MDQIKEYFHVVFIFQVWYEGTSTFYLNEDMKITKHIVEKSRNDADQTVQQMRDNVSQKSKL